MYITKIKEVFIDNQYREEYLNIVSTPHDGKGEVHHILPKCIYPEYIKESWNLVNLSYANHYRCHEILPFMVLGDEQKLKMLQAWNFICGVTSGEFVNQSEYVALRQNLYEMLSASMSGEGNHQYGNRGELNHNYGKVGPNKGRIWSSDTIYKFHLANKGENNNMFGKKQSDHTKKLIGDANRGAKNYWYGKTTSDRQKEVTSKRCLGLARTKEEKEKIGKAASFEVEKDGVIFPSQVAMARHFGVSKSTVGIWVRLGKVRQLNPEKRPNRTGGSKTPRKVRLLINGIEYPSAAEASKALGVSVGTLYNWRKKGLVKPLDTPKEINDNTQNLIKEPN
jgi:transposase-like protein